MLSGSGAARHYGYSSARVKAMSSKILSNKTMQEVINAKDIGTIIGILFREEFKPDIEEFGGMDIRSELVDFALSKNLAKDMQKLVEISPTTERSLTRAIMRKWELYNVRLAIEAKAHHKDYDSIARYVVDYGRYNAAALKEIMREESVEGILNRAMINSPYRDVLQDALDTYKKNKNVAETVAAMEKSYYKTLGRVIVGLRIANNESARIVKMEIDMKNILYMIKAKRLGMNFQDISNSLIENGNISMRELEQIYSNSRDVESMALQIKSFDLRNAVEVYKQSKIKQLLIFEVGLRNSIFENSIKLLRHSMLTFGTILAYAYMKEIEIFTLRIAINSRVYGLSKEETERLIVWKNE